MLFSRQLFLIHSIWILTVAWVEAAPGLTRITATPQTLYLEGETDGSMLQVVERPPGTQGVGLATPTFKLGIRSRFEVALPRFDQGRDRLYSSFQTTRGEEGIGPIRFVDTLRGLSKNTDPFPASTSKKGLQVQMLDDALELGVQHAALNLNFSQLVETHAKPGSLAWTSGARTFHFNSDYTAGMDHQIKTLSDRGVVVSLILLVYKSGDAAQNRVLLHPSYDPACPNHLGAFNTVTPEGAEQFIASLEFLAARYCASNYPYGRAANFILGNEVNSHWFWSNRGRCTMEEFANDYGVALRLAAMAVRKTSSSARVYVSLEHHWNIRYPGGDDRQTFAGRTFLEYLHRRGVEQGDFEWHVAFHPYPENLFECRTWNDQSATEKPDSPRITFKNLRILTDLLTTSPWKYDPPPNESYGRRVRRVILSEQGFHCADTPAGELWQAAAYAYAYRKAAINPGIDAFILHRHVDHAHEGGLNLGLWTHKKESIADPDRKRPMYEVFKQADQKGWESAFEFALPVIGIKSWSELK